MPCLEILRESKQFLNPSQRHGMIHRSTHTPNLPMPLELNHILLSYFLNKLSLQLTSPKWKAHSSMTSQISPQGTYRTRCSHRKHCTESQPSLTGIISHAKAGCIEFKHFCSRTADSGLNISLKKSFLISNVLC